MKGNLAHVSAIETLFEAIQQLPPSEKRRIARLIDALGAIPESARPLSAKLLAELAQLTQHDGQPHFDIIDLMIDYLQLQSAAIQHDARLPVASAESPQHVDN